MEDEINPLDINVKKDERGNTPCMSKVLRENMDDVIEVNACNKADDSKGKKRKEDLVHYVHQGSPNCKWIYAKQEKLIQGTHDKYQKWTWRN